MLPVYLVVGFINIFSQYHNYGIKIDDPNFDIRVRRSIEDTAKSPVLEIPNYAENDVLKREKREPYYRKTIITDNDITKNSETRIQRNVGNRYDIFNSNYSFINLTRNNQNNTGISNNNKPVLRPNQYRYPITGSNVATTNSGYRNQNDNTPEYYNYQNPSGRNFAGFAGYTDSTSGYNGVTSGYYRTPYAPLATNSAQPTGNSNGLYNSLAGNNKENMPQYAVNYNNAYSAFSNGYAPPSNGYAPASNGYAPASNGYAVPNNGNTAPSNVYLPSNTYATPSQNDYVFPSINDYNTTPGNVFPSATTNATPSKVFPSVDTNATPSNVIHSTIVTPSTNSTQTTTEKIKIKRVCVICNIPCPKFMKRFGSFCMDENYNDY